MRPNQTILVGGLALASQLLSGVVVAKKTTTQQLRQNPTTQEDVPNNQNQRKNEQHAPYYDDFYDDFYQTNPSIDYDDYYYGQNDDHPVVDDYYYYGKGGKKSKKHGKGGKGGKGGKKSKKGKGNTDDRFQDDRVVQDDFFIDDFFIFPPISTVSITALAFSMPHQVAVPVDPITNSTADVGTVFLYGNWTSNVQDITMWEIPATVDGEVVVVWVTLDGYCTRTGDGSQSLEGYCHFTYSVFDPVDNLLIGKFVAEGGLAAPPGVGVLTVVGGTGLFIGTTGLVMVSGAVFDDIGMLESAPAGLDIFDGVDGFLHSLEIAADQFFFLGESEN